MKVIRHTSVLIMPLIIAGCVEKFIPSVVETQFNIVVNGLITNQPEVYIVRLSWSIPLGINTTVALGGCDVTVHDDLGNSYQFAESSIPGTYLSDSTTFQGVVGRIYTLHINTNNATPTHHSYQSLPVEMKAVPPIDSLYYEKVIIKESTLSSNVEEGCQIYLNTFDPGGTCRFYRWDYSETWKFYTPYNPNNIYPNQICWISNNSKNIEVKSTSSLSEDRLNRYPILFISNLTDRLSTRYSIIVNQYSISENEFAYWEMLEDISEDTGGLYDKIPFSIPGNMLCVEDPREQVLGFFSVSSRTSKRIYIDENFRGLVNLYRYCPDDTFRRDPNIPGRISGLNEYRWLIIDDYREKGYVWTTNDRGCVDCTVRGTTTRPDFWEDHK